MFTRIPETFKEPSKPSKKSEKLKGIAKTFKEFKNLYKNSRNFQGILKTLQEIRKVERNSQFLTRNAGCHSTWAIKQATVPQNKSTMGRC
jgi:hypothetical protein